MSQFAKELKSYAAGLRTADDWLTLGRQVVDGTAPRSNATLHGQELDLFAHDQTHKKVKTPRRR